MPHTLSDTESALLLRHLLRHPADPALVPVIQSLLSSLITSRTASPSPYSATNSGELFPDFLGSGEFPEGFNDWDTPSLQNTSLARPDPSLSDLSLPNPSLPNLSLSNSDLLLPNPSLPNPSLSDLLDDRYSVNFERLPDAISDYTISCCNYGDPAVTSSRNDYGISTSLIFKDIVHDVRNTFVMLIQSSYLSLFPDCKFQCFG